jgi:hypothetical protein
MKVCMRSMQLGATWLWYFWLLTSVIKYQHDGHVDMWSGGTINAVHGGDECDKYKWLFNGVIF